ncbi:hypothetical protein AAC141_26355, partial [Pseudomonas sp. ZS001]|uniref:hypothetical protein n=1 Tax=Pseudomonas sp. ZS001 TaxID=3138070 RepID=UPI003139388E
MSFSRLGQGAAVQLAVGGEAEGVHLDERGGQHVVREHRGQPGAQFAGVLGAGGGEVGQQALLGVGQHHRFGHGWQGLELRLDLPQLDPETADLDLEVVAPQEQQHAVG